MTLPVFDRAPDWRLLAWLVPLAGAALLLLWRGREDTGSVSNREGPSRFPVTGARIERTSDRRSR